MAKVVGVGGVFIKTPDVDAWKVWYRTVLGLSVEDYGGTIFPHPGIGFSQVAAFPADSDYFAPSSLP